MSKKPTAAPLPVAPSSKTVEAPSMGGAKAMATAQTAVQKNNRDMQKRASQKAFLNNAFQPVTWGRGGRDGGGHDL